MPVVRPTALSLAVSAVAGLALFNTLGCGSTSPVTTPGTGTSSHASNVYYLNQTLSGNVAAYSLNIVSVTATGTPSPTTDALSNTYEAGSTAIDGSGNLYVGVYNTTTSLYSILIFTAAGGYTTPASTIAAPAAPENLAVDSSGDIFLADGTSTTVYKLTKSGSTYNQSTITDSNLSSIGVGVPGAIAVDGSGALHILGTPTSSSTAQVVDTFAASNTTGIPTSTLTLPSTTAANSTKVALSITTDTAGDLFAVNEDIASATSVSADIAEYAAASSGNSPSTLRDIPSPTLSTGYTEGTFVCAHVDSSGNVYSIFYQINASTNAENFEFVGYSTSSPVVAPTYEFSLPATTSLLAAEAFSIY